MRLKKVAAAAVAMVMAVSMLSVPVFAAAGDDGESATGSVNFNDTTNKNAGTAATEVYVMYSKQSTQLSVTVPTKVVIAVKESKSIIGPDNYTITNNSVLPVYVKSMKVEQIGDYQLTDSAPAATDQKINLKMKPGTNGEEFSVSTTGKNQTTDVTPKAGNWDISAETGKNTLNITFDGSVGKVDSKWATDTNATGVHLFTITYTIAAGEAQTSTNTPSNPSQD